MTRANTTTYSNAMGEQTGRAESSRDGTMHYFNEKRPADRHDEQVTESAWCARSYTRFTGPPAVGHPEHPANSLASPGRHPASEVQGRP